jgi:hypothetical protein
LGGLTYDGVYSSLMSASFGQSLHIDIEDRWQQTGDQTDVPRLD